MRALEGALVWAEGRCSCVAPAQRRVAEVLDPRALPLPARVLLARTTQLPDPPPSLSAEPLGYRSRGDRMVSDSLESPPVEVEHSSDRGLTRAALQERHRAWDRKSSFVVYRRKKGRAYIDQPRLRLNSGTFNDSRMLVCSVRRSRWPFTTASPAMLPVPLNNNRCQPNLTSKVNPNFAVIL